MYMYMMSIYIYICGEYVLAICFRGDTYDTTVMY